MNDVWMRKLILNKSFKSHAKIFSEAQTDNHHNRIEKYRARSFKTCDQHGLEVKEFKIYYGCIETARRKLNDFFHNFVVELSPTELQDILYHDGMKQAKIKDMFTPQEIDSDVDRDFLASRVIADICEQHDSKRRKIQ